MLNFFIGGGYLETSRRRDASLVLKFPSRLGVGLGLGLGLGLETLRLESSSRHYNNVGKAHRCCKYVMIFGKNRLFV